MDVKNLKLNQASVTNNGPIILQSVAPDYAYDADHKRTDKITGLKVTVVLPANGYDTLTVKVSDPTDRLSALLEKANFANPVYIGFEGFAASIYTMKDDSGRFRAGVSAKATAVRVIPGPEALDFGEEVIES